MKLDVSSLIKIAHTVLLAAVVTFVALVSVELWAYSDPGSMIEMKSGVVPKGEHSEVFFRLQNTGKENVTFTFTLRLYDRSEVHTSTWNVSVCPGNPFGYVIRTHAVDGLTKVHIQIHREGKDDPIRDLLYFVLDDEAARI